MRDGTNDSGTDGCEALTGLMQVQAVGYPPLMRWIALCAAAEAIGMTASASAAHLASGAAASAPSQLQPPSDQGGSPDVWLIVAGATLGLISGLLMPLLGGRADADRAHSPVAPRLRA